MSYIRHETTGLIARIKSYFPDHELHIRSGGKLRFIRISSKLQLRVVAIAATAFVLWLAFTLTMIGLQIAGVGERIALDQREREVHDSAARVAAYRESVEERVARLARRQQLLDTLVQRHFGNVEAGDEAAAEPAADAASSVIPAAAELGSLEQRQLGFARALREAVEARTRQAEAAIREVGLDPRQLSRQGMGGPLLPARTTAAEGVGEELEELEIALNRLAVIEMSLRAVPSSQPTLQTRISSPFGLRSDPFTGEHAMHTGIDFPGRHGQGIRAGGAGRVTFAGVRGGYGRTIEITHGPGVVTRYAHLSGIDVRPGQQVERGERIGRMGSTGRSTATHLHYEVRINGRPINPRPLLEADRNVLEIQSIAEGRNADSRERG